MGHYDKPVTDKPVEERTQDRTNHYVTGRDGGRDIDLRAFALQGMALHGRLQRHRRTSALTFDGDLERNLDAADEVYNGINALIDEHIAAHGLIVPEPAEPVRARSGGPYGYRGSRPGRGRASRPSSGRPASPATTAGCTRRSSTAPGTRSTCAGSRRVPGLYFIGLPWLHTWGSGRFAGIDRDAAHVAGARCAAPRGRCRSPATASG